LEGVGVDGLLKGLAQEVLAAFGVGEMAIDGEDDVVGDERLGGGEESEIALDGVALVGGEAVGRFPEGDVGLHGDLGGHPVVVTAGEVSLPCPAVLERKELVDVGAAVDHGFVVDAYARGAAGDGAEAGGVGAGDIRGRGLGEDKDRGRASGVVPVEGRHRRVVSS
jgi:hypothetical protein